MCSRDAERAQSAPVIPLPTQELLRFGLTAMVFSVLNMALCALDVILVRHLAGGAQAGLYAAAVQWSQFVWFIPIAVEGVMLQSTARLWAERRVGDVSSLVSRLLRYVMLGTAFLLLIVFALGDQIVILYFGPQFAEAALALRLLVPGAFCYAMARVLWPVIQAGGDGAHLDPGDGADGAGGCRIMLGFGPEVGSGRRGAGHLSILCAGGGRVCLGVAPSAGPYLRGLGHF